MKKLNINNSKLPPLSNKNTHRKKMGLINGELNLLMKNLGIEEEKEEIIGKDKNHDNDNLYSMLNYNSTPAKEGEETADNSDLYNTGNNFNKNRDP
jgi:hypothetical protein